MQRGIDPRRGQGRRALRVDVWFRGSDQEWWMVRRSQCTSDYIRESLCVLLSTLRHIHEPQRTDVGPPAVAWIARPRRHAPGTDVCAGSVDLGMGVQG